MDVDAATCRIHVELGERCVVRPWPRDHDVIDRPGKLVEEPAEAVKVGGIDRGDARFQFEADRLEAVRVPRGDDQLGTVFTREARRLEADAGTPTDHQDRLPAHVRLSAHDASAAPRTGTQPRSGGTIIGVAARSSETKINVTMAATRQSPPIAIIAGWYPCASDSARVLPAPTPIKIGTRAIAITPPTREAASLMAEASPRSASPTAARTAAVSGVTASPRPSPRTSAAGRTAPTYDEPGCSCASQICETPNRRIPANIGHLGPIRETSAPLNGAITMKTSVTGISAAPACVAV